MDKPSDLKKKTLIQLKDVASTVPRASSDSRRRVTSLSVCSEQWTAEKQRIQLAVPQQNRK